MYSQKRTFFTLSSVPFLHTPYAGKNLDMVVRTSKWNDSNQEKCKIFIISGAEKGYVIRKLCSFRGAL